MQELEILEEIEQKKEKCLNVVKMEIDPMEITIHREQYKGLCMAEESIRKHMNDGWISVDDRLPEEPKENPEFEGKKIELYLVTVKGTKYPFRAFWNGKQFTDGWSVLNVIAWRPLPEPYHPERSDDK